ncbi:uncharacterized protein LOC134786321 [Penaeus indicus]|uniref:uncharacterized protein LOC134786321 n=1 Tax=Penaeus indicus TaxID=29960 RepID=UPI00300D5D55
MGTLRQVSGEELEALRDRMTQYLPYSAGIHGFIEMILKCQLQQILDVKVYIPDTPQPSSLVLITPSCSQPNIQSVTIFWDTEEEEDKDVVRMLKTLPQWDWSAPIYFRLNPTAVYNKLQQYMTDGMLTTAQMRCHKIIDGHLFSLDSPDVPHFKIPEGFSINSLQPEDIPIVISQWESKWYETQAGLESLLTKLPSVAIRSHQTNGSDESASEHSTERSLVAFSYLYHIGLLANIFTMPEHRRRGLGRAVALTMVEKLRQKKLPVRSVVDGSNGVSISYHQKLGFKKQCNMKIFLMLPVGKTMEDYKNVLLFTSNSTSQQYRWCHEDPASGVGGGARGSQGQDDPIPALLCWDPRVHRDDAQVPVATDT